MFYSTSNRANPVPNATTSNVALRAKAVIERTASKIPVSKNKSFIIIAFYVIKYN